MQGKDGSFFRRQGVRSDVGRRVASRSETRRSRRSRWSRRREQRVRGADPHRGRLAQRAPRSGYGNGATRRRRSSDSRRSPRYAEAREQMQAPGAATLSSRRRPPARSSSTRARRGAGVGRCPPAACARATTRSRLRSTARPAALLDSRIEYRSARPQSSPATNHGLDPARQGAGQDGRSSSCARTSEHTAAACR